MMSQKFNPTISSSQPLNNNVFPSNERLYEKLVSIEKKLKELKQLIHGLHFQKPIYLNDPLNLPPNFSSPTYCGTEPYDPFKSDSFKFDSFKSDDKSRVKTKKIDTEPYDLEKYENILLDLI